MRPVLPPKKLPIDLVRIETSKGNWGIFVESVVETRAGHNLLVKLILEQAIDDEHFRMRNLEVIANARVARDPDRAQDIAGRIKDWIESTEGDGFVDFDKPSN